jgi:RimJ/RimL family protein N-acetyltransferase
MFAVTRKGEDRAVALVGPWNPPDWPERELGWMVLDGAAEGQGIAREAAQGALRHIWQNLNWDTVVSYIAEGNARSVALAERLGARLDPEAEVPEVAGQRLMVYRHPRPEALA